MSAGASLRLDRVSKRYGANFAANDVSLEIGAGRFVTLLGPSGSGKTTLLMMIAGFVRPTSGAIILGDRNITNLPPEAREFGMVFQGYALFPNMTVADNLAFPLKLRKMNRAAIDRDISRMLEVVKLEGLEGRYPRELSGGQQQRVALARALIFDPKVLLLDESLSALDKKLRAGLQEELRDLHQRLGTTFVFVTHDQDEALSMSDEIVIINHGRIVQQGAPKALYDAPNSRFVADFLGRSNFIEAVVIALDNGHLIYRAGGKDFRQVLGQAALPGAPGAPVLIGLRPENLKIDESEPEAANRIPGTIVSVTYEGADFFIRTNGALGSLQVVRPSSSMATVPSVGTSVWLSWASDASMVLRDDR